MNNIKTLVYNFFTKGHERTLRAKKNVVGLFGLRAVDQLISLALVPLLLNYLGDAKYGIWVTLFAVVNWFGLFNIGLGQGLRNKLAQSIADDNIALARTYVSTSYALISIIFIGVLFLFSIINPFLPWSNILNVDFKLSENLVVLTYVIFNFFFLRFIFRLINAILMALQQPALANSLRVFGRVLALIGIFILINLSSTNSIIMAAIIMSSGPVLALFVSSIIFFNGILKKIKPSLNYVNFKYTNEIMSLGIQFFIIQISTIVLFATDNFIITQIMGPESVTPYHITRKYFLIAFTFFAIIVQPYWSAITEAYKKNEIKWIKNSINKLIRIWLVYSLGVIFMALIAEKVFLLWLGKDLQLNASLLFVFAVFIIARSLNSIFTKFINGVGKLRIQIYISIFSIIFNIPLSIFFAKTLNFGLTGIITATLVSVTIGAVLTTIQYYKIINNKAWGIWGK